MTRILRWAPSFFTYNPFCEVFGKAIRVDLYGIIYVGRKLFWDSTQYVGPDCHIAFDYRRSVFGSDMYSGKFTKASVVDQGDYQRIVQPQPSVLRGNAHREINEILLGGPYREDIAHEAGHGILR